RREGARFLVGDRGSARAEVDDGALAHLVYDDAAGRPVLRLLLPVAAVDARAANDLVVGRGGGRREGEGQGDDDGGPHSEGVGRGGWGRNPVSSGTRSVRASPRCDSLPPLLSRQQGREETSMENEAMRERAAAVLSAWNSHDVNRVVACYTEDVVYRDPNTRGAVEGKGALSRY